MGIGIRSQLDLLSLSRSSYYYKSLADKEKDQNIANAIYEIWFAHPFYGYRKITAV